MRFAEALGLPLERTGTKVTIQFADQASALEDMVKTSCTVSFLGAAQDNARCDVHMNMLASDQLAQYDAIIGMTGLARLSRHHGLNVLFDNNEITMRQSPNDTPIRVVLRAQGSRAHHIPRAEVMSRHVEFESEVEEGTAGRLEAEIRRDFQDLFEPLDGTRPSLLPEEIHMSFRHELQASTPVRYSISPADHEILSETIKDLLDRGIIERSSSRFAAPAFLVKKEGLDPQGRARKRLVVDFRKLNEALEDATSTWAPLRAEDLARSLAEHEFHSTIDLKDGYYMTSIAAGDRDYCSFSTPTGIYRYRRAPMGLKLSAAAFQANLNHVLHDVMLEHPGKVHVFVDDICVSADSLEENRAILLEVLDRLRLFGVKANEGKLKLFRRRVNFLGFSCAKGGFTLQDRANQAGDIPTPKTKKDVRSFTSFLSYFRAHIDNLAARAEPLHRLQRKDVAFEWGATEDAAFRDLKAQLARLHTLAPPSRAAHPSFFLYSDASLNGIAGHLCEGIDGKLQPLGFFSEALPTGASTWSIEERELLAATRSLSHFEHLICSGTTTVLCDCRPLVLALQRNRLEGDRARRLVSKLLDHNVCLVHHEGESNRADFGSRQFPAAAPKDTWTPTRAEVNARRANLEDASHGGAAPAGAMQTWSTGIDKEVWRAAYKLDAAAADIITTLESARAEDSPWHSRYELQDGLLLLRPHASDERRLYVPSGLRQSILTDAHDSDEAGHGGSRKTLHRIMQSFYWPGMRGEIKLYVRGCLTCLKAKPFTPPSGPLHPIEVPPVPYAAICMDLVTALPRATAFFDGEMREVDAVLTVADLLTHFTHFFAVPKTITGEQVAQILINQVFIPQCAVPNKIVSDRDPRWTSAVVRGMLSAMGTRLALSTARSPTTNGVAEAKNKHLVTYLKTVGDRARNWPMLLGTAALAYNSGFCESIGMAPAEARFGAVTKFPYEVRIGTGDSTGPLKALQEAQEMVLACAKDALRDSGDKTIGGRKQRFPRPLQVGDEVLVDSTVLLPLGRHAINRKVSPRFLGPYRVLRKISPEAYEIQLPSTSRAHKTLSIRFLRRVVPTHEKFPLRPKPPTDARAEALMDYVVDKILGHRGTKRSLRFKVRWLGYPDSEATWEPIQNFSDEDGHVTNDILSEYLHDHDMIIP